ncbi:hypothetical protein FHL15_008198 [Xylaria flabelliformis]|uniref:Uncharacterized protein n=1 Tax=Xylaria flabelliformis TaxID=2512241 RepID=A0A553HSS0_9PEZI|nr:hypothetical protein FHL15_008198 [Xylaria flabelliformis]
MRRFSPMFVLLGNFGLNLRSPLHSDIDRLYELFGLIKSIMAGNGNIPLVSVDTAGPENVYSSFNSSQYTEPVFASRNTLLPVRIKDAMRVDLEYNTPCSNYRKIEDGVSPLGSAEVLGGKVGDIANGPFVEALRKLKRGKDNYLHTHREVLKRTNSPGDESDESKDNLKALDGHRKLIRDEEEQLTAKLFQPNDPKSTWIRQAWGLRSNIERRISTARHQLFREGENILSRPVPRAECATYGPGNKLDT